MPDLNDDSLNRLLGDDPITTSISVRIRQDEQTLSNLERRFNSIRKEAEGIAKALKEAGVSAQRLGAQAGGTPGTSGAGRVGSTPVAGGLFTPTPLDKGTGFSGRITQMISNFGAGTGAPTTGGGVIGSATMQAVNAVTQAIDARVDRGREYALSADRMTMLFQQMKGMSQVAIQNTYRQPLTQYKLGAGGINTMLGLEAATGLRSSLYAPGVEALRVSSGFSVSNQGAASMLAQLASPEVVNRMFMMTGTSLIGPGGRQNDIMSVMQRITQQAGLTNPAIARSAMLPGSVTRANLATMGITGEFQNQLLQYAQQNLAYQSKGGKGMYDPGSKSAQKLMGIDSNFAMQAEETERRRGKREEEFYSRQADNFADLERQTQRLVGAMAALEDALSPIIGFQTSNRVGGQIAGAIGTGLGAAVGGFFGGPPGAWAGAAAGNLLGRGVGWLVGGAVKTGDITYTADAMERRVLYADKPKTPSATSLSTTPTATSPTRSTSRNTTKEQVKPNATLLAQARRDSLTESLRKRDEAAFMRENGMEVFMAFTKVLDGKRETTLADLLRHPKLLNMNPIARDGFIRAAMQANKEGTIIGVGSGWRSHEEQIRLFTDRYAPVNYDTGIEWQGQFWQKKSPDLADAAVPGASWSNHEHGLAFDITGDITWLQKNADRFGFENFAHVNDEPWHFQVKGLKGKQGGGIAFNEETKYTPPGIEYGPGGVGYSESTSKEQVLQALYDSGIKSVSWTRDVNGKRDKVGLDYLPVADRDSIKNPISNKNSSLIRGLGAEDRRVINKVSQLQSGKTFGPGLPGSSADYVNWEQMARIMHEKGMTGEEIVQALAVMGRESGGNRFAWNNVNENSVGLFQINLNTPNWEQNLRDWNLTSINDLTVPENNIQVLLNHLRYNADRGVDPWYNWGPYKGMSHMYGTSSHFDKALSTTQSLGYINNYTGPMPVGDLVPKGSKNQGRRDGYVPSPSPMGMAMMSAQGAMSSGMSQQPIINGGNTITISPTINITNSGATLDQDLEGMARKIAAMLEKEVNRATIRRT